MPSTAIRIKGHKALPAINDETKPQVKFFKKLLEYAEAGDYVNTDIDFSSLPDTPYDDQENDTVITLTNNTPLKLEPKLDWHDMVIWYITTARDAQELEINDDEWDFTATNAKRRTIFLKAKINEEATHTDQAPGR
jgi:hypothetical protein